ncbi:MAG: ATP-binding protein, partial [Oscillochloris sp.]|nr:ATP-binding protein [Oscillochloris sp.]
MMATSANPYVGPRPFQRKEKLYGRDWEVNELRDLLLTHRVVLLHSPSGAGKTSLLNANLLPLIEREGFAATPPLRVNTPPPTGVSPVPNRYLASLVAQIEPGMSAGQLAERSLRDALQAFFAERPAGTLGNLLVLDQFEEILTIDPTDYAAKQVLFSTLGALVRDPSWMLLFAMREDYIGAIEPFARPLPGRLSARFRLDLLSERSALDAIQLPACDASVIFDLDAARLLVEDLRQVRVQQPDGAWQFQTGLYIEPMQLQLVCRRLWEQPRPDPTRISADDVRKLGNIDDTLGAYYSEEVRRIAADEGVPERFLRDWVERELITIQGLRGQVLKGAATTAGLTNSVI